MNIKRSYRLKVDCAACADKIERAVARLNAVVSARVNFMTQRLTLELRPEAEEGLVAEINRVIKRIGAGAGGGGVTPLASSEWGGGQA